MSIAVTDENPYELPAVRGPKLFLAEQAVELGGYLVGLAGRLLIVSTYQAMRRFKR